MAKENEAISEFDNLSPQREAIAKKIYSAAKDAGIDPEYALSIGWIENRFKPQGVSEADAIGPMQIWKYNAPGLGVKVKDLYDPDTNIKLGIQLLKSHLEKHNGDKTLAAIEYNSTPAVTKRFIKSGFDTKVLPKETRNYLVQLNELHRVSSPEEKSPFDEEPTAQVEDEDSPFGKTEAAPGWLLSDDKQPENTTFLQDIGAFFGNTKNDLSGIGGAIAQEYMNRKMDNENLTRSMQNTAQTVQNLEQQYKTSQSQQPNVDRILQGGMEEGLTGRQRQSYNDITSARAAQARQQQQVLDELARRGQIAPDYRPRIMSQAMPTESTPSGVIYSGQRLNEEQRRLIEEAEKNKPAIQRVKESIFRGATSPIPSAITKVGSFGLNRYLGPLSTGYMAAQASNQLQKAERLESSGDLLGANIARMNAYASGLGAIPATSFMPLNFVKGAGMIGSGGLSGLGMVRDYLFPYKSVTETPK